MKVRLLPDPPTHESIKAKLYSSVHGEKFLHVVFGCGGPAPRADLYPVAPD